MKLYFLLEYKLIYLTDISFYFGTVSPVKICFCGGDKGHEKENCLHVHLDYTQTRVIQLTKSKFIKKVT